MALGKDYANNSANRTKKLLKQMPLNTPIPSTIQENHQLNNSKINGTEPVQNTEQPQNSTVIKEIQKPELRKDTAKVEPVVSPVETNYPVQNTEQPQNSTVIKEIQKPELRKDTAKVEPVVSPVETNYPVQNTESPKPEVYPKSTISSNIGEIAPLKPVETVSEQNVVPQEETPEVKSVEPSKVNQTKPQLRPKANNLSIEELLAHPEPIQMPKREVRLVKVYTPDETKKVEVVNPIPELLETVEETIVKQEQNVGQKQQYEEMPVKNNKPEAKKVQKSEKQQQIAIEDYKEMINTTLDAINNFLEFAIPSKNKNVALFSILSVLLFILYMITDNLRAFIKREVQKAKEEKARAIRAEQKAKLEQERIKKEEKIKQEKEQIRQAKKQAKKKTPKKTDKKQNSSTRTGKQGFLKGN